MSVLLSSVKKWPSRYSYFNMLSIDFKPSTLTTLNLFGVLRTCHVTRASCSALCRLAIIVITVKKLFQFTFLKLYLIQNGISFGLTTDIMFLKIDRCCACGMGIPTSLMHCDTTMSLIIIMPGLYPIIRLGTTIKRREEFFTID